MKFPSLELTLSRPPEAVEEALLHGGLKQQFEKAGWLVPGSAARKLEWSRRPEGGLEGRLGYWASKNLCVFRFRADVAASEGGSRVVLSAGHGPWSPTLRVLTYVLGLCMCGIGVLFAWLGDKLILAGMGRVLEYQARVMRDWGGASA